MNEDTYIVGIIRGGSLQLYPPPVCCHGIEDIEMKRDAYSFSRLPAASCLRIVGAEMKPMPEEFLRKHVWYKGGQEWEPTSAFYGDGRSSSCLDLLDFLRGGEVEL